MYVNSHVGFSWKQAAGSHRYYQKQTFQAPISCYSLFTTVPTVPLEVNGFPGNGVVGNEQKSPTLSFLLEEASSISGKQDSGIKLITGL